VKESTSWDVTLLAWEQKKADGTKVERYGTKPQGVAFFDAKGRFIIAVMKSDRTNYASNALWQGTHTKTQKPPTARLLTSELTQQARQKIASQFTSRGVPFQTGMAPTKCYDCWQPTDADVRPIGGDVVDVIWRRANNVCLES
jgi:hypothetical protein